MTEKLRFGLVGCGVIGPLHAEAIASLPDAQLDAVTDIVAERAEKLAASYGARAYTDMNVMLARERLDVVTICTPSGMHGEHACCAMCADCHVIVEKPMEIHLAAIDEMLRVQKERGVKLAVISQHRFDPASQKVRALVDEGAFGRLVLGNALVPWWRSQAYYDSGTWRGTWKLDGGGVLMNGALGTITATTGAYPGLATRLEIFGAQGSAVIEGDELGFLHLARDEREAPGAYGSNVKTSKPREGEANSASNPGALAINSHALQIADMIRAIREDGTPLVDGHAARRPVEIILGIYEASRTGKEVILP